jgi:hypothetical protein
MSLFAVLFRTAILFCLCKTQERPCVNHSGFRIGAVFIFLFGGKQPDNGSLSTVFHLPFYLALLHWRKIGQNEAEKLSEFNWRFSAFSSKAA